MTKKADTLGVTAEAGIKSLGGQTYNFTATAPTFWNGSLLIGGHYDASDNDFRFQRGDKFLNYFRPDWNKLDWRQHNDYSNKDAMLKWQNDHFSFKAAYKETERSLPPSAAYQYESTTYSSWDTYNTQEVKHTDLVGGYRNTWGDLDFGLQLNYLKQKKNTQSHNLPPDTAWGMYPIFPGAHWSKRETERWGGQLDLSYKLTERNLLEFHADFSDEELRVDANDWHLSTGHRNEENRFFPLYTEKRTHLQIQDTITLDQAETTKLTASYKMDKVESTGNNRGDSDWRDSYGLALVKDIDDNWSFRASYGTFNRYPNFTERFGDGLNVLPTYVNRNWGEPVTWEEGEQWDVGFDWRGQFLGAGGKGAISYFNRYTENMMTAYINRQFTYYANAGKATVEGVEMEAALNWQQFDLDFSATWQRAKKNDEIFVRGVSSAGLSGHLTNIPKWEYYLRGNYRFPGDSFSLFAEYHFIDSLYKTNDYGIQIGSNVVGSWTKDDPLGLVNAGFRWQLNDQISLTAGVNDMLNKGPKQGQFTEAGDGHNYRYASLVSYPQPGRTYYATLRYEFGGHENSSKGDSALAAAAGDFSGIKEIGEDSSFYIAPKVIYSKLNIDLSGEDWNFGGGPDGTGYVSDYTDIFGFPYVERDSWFAPGVGLSRPILGGDKGSSGVAGGLAAGVDLYKLHGIPVRLEIEGNMHGRRNLDYKQYTFGHKNATTDGLRYFQSEQNLQSSQASVFLNGYIDWHNATRFTPYVGGGLGLSRYNHKITQKLSLEYREPQAPAPCQYDFCRPNNLSLVEQEYSKSTKGWDFAWNLAAGFSYQINESTHLDLSYRYVDYGKQKLPTTIDHEIRKKFPPPCMADCSPADPVLAYGDSSGQTLKMDSHQAVLALRFDLGAGEQTRVAYRQKTAGSGSFFDNFSGPGLLAAPAVQGGSFTISPRLGLFFPSKDFGVEDAYVGGLSLGYNLSRNWGVEASYDVTNHANSNFAATYSGKTRVNSARLNAVYHVVAPENELSRWVPYATAGLGAVWSKGTFQDHAVRSRTSAIIKRDQPTGNYQSFAINAGLGLKYFLNKNVALRLEALDTYAFSDADFGRDKGPYHNVAFTGGLHFQFSGH